MKVCFLIAPIGPSQGGHFRDLESIVESLRGRVECIVIAIGTDQSPVLDQIPELHYVNFNGFNIVSALRKLLKLARTERIDVINCFDVRIYGLARLASIILRKPMLFTKCGGPNPRRFYPYSDYLVVFSKENNDYFHNHPKYRETEVYVLPGRTKKVRVDSARVSKLRQQINHGCPVFLIVSRFCEYYLKNMLQAIDLIKCLNVDGAACQLLVVGIPEDPETVATIRTAADAPYLHVITDEEFTHNASELIGIADFVIGTGRGFMEAASQGKVLLTPLSACPHPLLVTDETFREVFATNFSPRNQVLNFNAELNYREILRLTEDEPSRTQYQDMALTLFESCFNVDKHADQYVKIFNQMNYRSGFYLLDIVFGFLSFWKSIWYLRSRKLRARS